jgi:hypothetical protein
MGYTNYWHQHNDFTDEQWNKIKDEYENYVKPLAGNEIKDNSDVNNIIFDGGCETFVLSKFSEKEPDRRYKEQDLSLHFCKTRMDKYDIYVWYLLTYINRLCPDFSISRDQ